MFHVVQNDRSLNEVHKNVQNITLHSKLWTQITLYTSGKYKSRNLTVGLFIVEKTSESMHQ